GLGYYNRVRNMQKAARYVAEQYGGRLPTDVKKLRELPGIGEYTAGAIASIAWDTPVPAVDGNVLRIWARLTASYDDILKQSVRRRATEELAAVMPQNGSGDLNQAFMDLGSSLCTPNGQADCGRCPLAFICKAYKKGLAADLPVRKKPAPRRKEEYTVLVIRDGSRVAFRRRPEKGLLAGLYEFPNLQGHISGEDVLAFLEKRGLEPLYIERLEPAKHIFSHIEWRMEGYLVRVAALEEKESGDWVFADTGTAEEEYPLPAAFAAYASYINIRLGSVKARKGEQE
ncbi:MAG TPA: A/G-specific adenine glycosylase, partial [Lachnospiraceae bacterium]|nr:A/G-specific adenine glycosylase [Lachnospiraceae bacterium]